MRQGLLLVGAFIVTLALLLGVYLAVAGGLPSGVAAVVSPSPSAAPSRSPRPSVATPPSASPSPSTSASPSIEPSPSWTPVPIMSGSPGMTPVPEAWGGASTTVTVLGRNYKDTAVNMQPHSTITRLASGSVVMTSTADDSQPTTIMYELPSTAVPAGRQIARLDTVICGSGGGNFWEVYGPDGSDPAEYEAALPAADGCWHFTRAPGTDRSVHADIQLESSMRIDKVVFTIWLR